MSERDDDVVRRGTSQLRELLPSGWKVSASPLEGERLS